MLKGALVAFGIMLVSIPIPIVHFIAVPLSPFIGGFVGGGIARADEERIIWFGLLVAGLMAIPAVATGLALAFADSGSVLGANRTLLIVFAAAIVPYAWFGVTVGALVSYAFRAAERRNRAPADELSPGGP